MKLRLSTFKMEQKQVQWSAAHEEDNSRRKACLKNNNNDDRKNSKENSKSIRTISRN